MNGLDLGDDLRQLRSGAGQVAQEANGEDGVKGRFHRFLILHDPVQRVGDAHQDVSDQGRHGIIALLQFAAHFPQDGDAFPQDVRCFGKERFHIAAQIIQGGFPFRWSFRVHEIVEGVQAAFHVHQQAACGGAQARGEVILQCFPFFLNGADLHMERRHGVQGLGGQSEAALITVESRQQPGDGFPIVDQIHHFGGFPLPEDFLEHGVHILAAFPQLIQLGEGGDGVVPVIGIVDAADAQELRYLISLSAQHQLGHSAVQILKGVAAGGHSPGILLDGLGIGAPVSGDILPAIHLGGGFGYHVPQGGNSVLYDADHAEKDALNGPGHGFAHAAQLAHGVGGALGGHHSSRRSIRRLPEAAARFPNRLGRFGQPILHLSQGGPGVIELLFPLGDHFLVVAVFFLCLGQGCPEGFDDLFLLGDLLLQVPGPGLVFLLFGGVGPQFCGFRLELAAQGFQIALGLFEGRAVLFFPFQHDSPFDFLSHIPPPQPKARFSMFAPASRASYRSRIIYMSKM